MASTTYARLVSANTRVGVDSRKRVNSVVPREVRRGDNLSVEKITGLGYPAATNWGDMMTGMCAAQSNAGTRTVFSKVALYTDMADEPWKYGDDILEWTALDEQLRNGNERASVTAYWADREVLQQAERARKTKANEAERKAWMYTFKCIAKEAAKFAAKRWVQRDIKRHVERFNRSVTKIQSLIRGYQTRSKDAHQDCCMCLSHRISPLKTTVGYMCRDCAEMGPYEDLVEEDPWNWHRAEYIDEAPNVCFSCVWCTKDMPMGCCDDYCSYECEWKDRTV